MLVITFLFQTNQYSSDEIIDRQLKGPKAVVTNLGSTRYQNLYYSQWEGVHRMFGNVIGPGGTGLKRLGIADVRLPRGVRKILFLFFNKTNIKMILNTLFH